MVIGVLAPHGLGRECSFPIRAAAPSRSRSIRERGHGFHHHAPTMTISGPTRRFQL